MEFNIFSITNTACILAEIHMDFGVESACTPQQNPHEFHVSSYLMGIRVVAYTTQIVQIFYSTVRKKMCEKLFVLCSFCIKTVLADRTWISPSGSAAKSSAQNKKSVAEIRTDTSHFGSLCKCPKPQFNFQAEL